MFLTRCSTRLNRVNVRASFLRSDPIAYFSSDETSKKGENEKKKIVEKSTEKTEEVQTQQKDRIKNLLNRLSKNSSLNIVREVQTAKPMGYKKIAVKHIREKPKRTVDAVKAVANEIGGRQVANDLLDSLNSADKESDLDAILALMQTPKTVRMSSNTTEDKKSDSKARTNYMGRFRPPTREKLSENRSNIDDRRQNRSSVFGGTPLNIFDVGNLIGHQNSLNTWNELEQYEVRLNMSYAPRNYFEKMAYWTEEGKIWKFPIDNEQGLDTEHQTPFTDHVFLEDLLEGWCPRKGAVRNFMELICVGLSKNPYLTVQEKREHIEWYRNYFNEKSHILQKVSEQNELQLKQATKKLIQ